MDARHPIRRRIGKRTAHLSRRKLEALFRTRTGDPLLTMRDHARHSLSCKSARLGRPGYVAETSSVSFLMCPFCVRALLTHSTTPRQILWVTAADHRARESGRSDVAWLHLVPGRSSRSRERDDGGCKVSRCAGLSGQTPLPASAYITASANDMPWPASRPRSSSSPRSASARSMCARCCSPRPIGPRTLGAAPHEETC